MEQIEIRFPRKRYPVVLTRTALTGKKLFKKHFTKYLFMLDSELKNGLDIRTAIWVCYNKLENDVKKG